MGLLRGSVVWALVLVLGTAWGQQDKWVWGSSGRSLVSDRDDYRGQFPVPSGGGYRPPAPVHETSDLPGRPPFLGPDLRPETGPGPLGVRPGVGVGGGRPVLTGPVPSWDQHRLPPGGYKSFDRCKCAHSFNCNSPGISFGSCDVGKQYCCYDIKHNGFGVDRPGVGLDRPGLGFDRPGIGLDRPGIGLDRPGIGLDRPGIGLDRPGIGLDRPGIGLDRPGIGLDRPGIGLDRPGIGLDRPGIGLDRPGIGLDRPGIGLDRPGLGLDRPGFGLDRPGSGPGLGVNRPGPGFGLDRPGFGDRPVLVGPGGPTGVAGRPPPFDRDGDFYDEGPLFDGYGRSASDKKKGDKKP